MTRRTKIVCTIGPASDSEETITKLIASGMNVARLNFSHGTTDYHRGIIDRLKKIRKALRKPVAILMDLQGPKIRIGKIRSGSAVLRPGQKFILTTSSVAGDERRVSVSLKSLPYEVAAGHPILLADGNIELRVERVSAPEVICRVVVGGTLSSQKGMNLPAADVEVESITPKDRKDIEVGVDAGVDAVAVSFVRNAADIKAVKAVLKKTGGRLPVIAKIEKQAAVNNIDRILDVADGIMVARGDLGVEIDLERVPLVQKSIIQKCNTLGKPVITATQMLVRMVENPRPTRAEAADVANAVLDGTDAVMLSEETAIGNYPVEAVQMMDRIVRTAETSLDRRKFEHVEEMGNIRDSITRSSYYIAKEIGVRAIVTPTWSGSTANLVARFRPKQPILATTPNETTLDFLSFSWGVVPLFIPPSATIDD
ncbi:MAG TPA: pyruvate kinase, partial [Terriglobia bacterium]|nr:pyruvate kinase [Terriglobia bacterium]